MMRQFSLGIGMLFLLGLGNASAQNVGIGTSHPLSKLHISSSASSDGLLIDNVGGNGDPQLQFGIDGQPILTMGLDDSDGDKFKIGTSSINSNTRLTIQSNGYIGIGTSNPSFNLHVSGNRSGQYVGFFENLNVQGGGLAAYSSTPTNALGGLTEHNDGLGIYAAHLPMTGRGWAIWGTSNSSDAIGVRGSIPAVGASLGYGGYFAGGLGYVNGLFNLSDARTKRNIAPLTDALGKVMRLRGVTYQYDTEHYGKYVGNDQRTYTGFIAQEVEQVVPQAVAEKYLVADPSGDKGSVADLGQVDRETVKVVDYVSLVPVLVEAIKEQQRYIQQLEQRLQELEDKE